MVLRENGKKRYAEYFAIYFILRRLPITEVENIYVELNKLYINLMGLKIKNEENVARTRN